jgi:CarboxypepD_reg-like domain
MQIIQCIAFILGMLVITPVKANDVLSRRVEVVFRQTPIQDALDEVARIGRFEWSYNPKLIDRSKRVSLTANDWTIREILFEVLGNGYQFKTNGNYLIIKRSDKYSDELSGYIRDPKTGQRLANATVYDRRTLRATTTDSTGYYRIKVKKQTQVIVARLGYRDTILEVKPNTPRYQKIVLRTDSLHPTPKREPLFVLMESAASDFERFFDATLDKWHTLNVPDSFHRRFQISLLPAIGTNHVLSGKVENDFSFNVLAGMSQGVRYAEVAGIANFTKKDVKGFQGAGVVNLVKGNCSGVQLAGVHNETLDTLSGIQGAGLMNLALHTDGFALQAAGLMNYGVNNQGALIQAAGVLNIADTLRSVQAAGVFNRARVVEGIQVAGLVNSAREIRGLQTSGLVNQAHTVKGLQIAGVVNTAKKVRGVQIGFINNTRNLRGIQIGLINKAGKIWFPFILIRAQKK